MVGAMAVARIVLPRPIHEVAARCARGDRMGEPVTSSAAAKAASADGALRLNGKEGEEVAEEEEEDAVGFDGGNRDLRGEENCMSLRANAFTLCASLSGPNVHVGGDEGDEGRVGVGGGLEAEEEGRKGVIDGDGFGCFTRNEESSPPPASPPSPPLAAFSFMHLD